MKHIDYAKVSQDLKEYYGCDKILIDFLELKDKIVINKVFYTSDGRMRTLQPTSYDYSDFERITARLENETHGND